MKRYISLLCVCSFAVFAASCQTAVRITSPADNAVFSYGEEIPFAADTGDADITALVWSSSIDGELGTGTPLTTTALSVGVHTITLTVTLTDASTLTDRISLTVTPPPVVEVGSTIDTLTTWESTNIYVVTRWFDINGALIIEPGTIVKFKPATYINVNGTLSADGTPESPIIFTSFKDDAHGGDTNGDAGLTSPTAGDWGNIKVLGDRNESLFNNCRFYYAGIEGPWGYTLGIQADGTTVTNCVFAHNKGDKGANKDNADGALNARDAGSSTLIAGNIFYANEKPMRIGCAMDIDGSNTFYNPDDPTQTNTYNAIFVSANSDVAGDRTWAETDVPFVIEPWSMLIPTGSSLTLADGSILKFKNNFLRVESANLYNYGGEGVWFTSWKDDSLGGDSNADGTLTSPAAGDWQGITLGAVGGPRADWANIVYD